MRLSKKNEIVVPELGKFQVYRRSEYLLQYSELASAISECRFHSEQDPTPPGILNATNFVLDGRTIDETARDILIYWEECLGCRIRPIRFGDCVMFVDHQKESYWEFAKVLGPEYIGWIILGDWLPADAFRPLDQKSSLNLNKNLSPERFKIG